MLEDSKIKMPSCYMYYYQLLEVHFCMCLKTVKPLIIYSLNSELRPKIKCAPVMPRTVFSDWPEGICRNNVFIHYLGFYTFSPFIFVVVFFIDLMGQVHFNFTNRHFQDLFIRRRWRSYCTKYSMYFNYIP